MEALGDKIELINSDSSIQPSVYDILKDIEKAILRVDFSSKLADFDFIRNLDLLGYLGGTPYIIIDDY